MKEIFDNPNEKYSQEFIERFKTKIDTENKDINDCWLWNAAIQSKGYGSIGIGNGKTALAHRVAYELANNMEIPRNLCVRHSCHIRCCTNPKHLKIGTTADNNRDMVQAGRQVQGENNGRSKQTEEDVSEMKKIVKFGKKTMIEMAKEKGLHYNTIRYAIKGKTWKGNKSI
jgi:hypothetical protein